jgi:hypothetical protein
MTSLRLSLVLATVATLLAEASAISAQRSFVERFASHNAAMNEIQPTMAGMLVTSSPRLTQNMRFAVSHHYTSAGTETVSYGNGKGIGIIVGNRIELDAMQPPYIQHYGSAADGFGDATVGAKIRIASGNAEHGNFIVSSMLNYRLATGSHKNGAAANAFSPALAAGHVIRRFAVISYLGGTLPTGKIAKEGRSIAWNSALQAHATKRLWLAVEDNATFYLGGSHDGLTQNFVAPSVFYTFRRNEWKPTHPFTIVDCGMQIATSEFHTYNHNLVVEARVFF